MLRRAGSKRTFTVCGERVGDSSTVEQRTLTPSILVRIHVNKPIKSISWRIVSADLANVSALCQQMRPTRAALLASIAMSCAMRGHARARPADKYAHG